MSAPHAQGPSLREIVGGVAEDAQGLIRGEIALARAELDEKLHRMIMAAVWMIGGMLVAFAGLIILLLAGVPALAIVVPAWAASLIIGFIVILIGALLARSGLAMLSLAKLTPDRTARNLQRDAQVVKEHS